MSAAIERMAYVGQKPWHDFGTQLTQGADKATWRREAGLEYEVRRAVVQYQNGQLHQFTGQNVLYCSDDGRALSVVSDDYREIQPAECLDFFDGVAQELGCEIETAGTLSGRKKIWALAKTGENARIAGTDDVIKGYILFATSYDKSMSTVAMHTSVRVVCQNTLALATQASGGVRVPHSTKFDAHAARVKLGLVQDVWKGFEEDCNRLHEYKVQKASEAASFYARVLYGDEADTEQLLKDRDRNLVAVMETFRRAKGQEPTAWGLVNGATAYVDHVKGRTRETALNAAWFGEGAQMKQEAWRRGIALVGGDRQQVEVRMDAPVNVVAGDEFTRLVQR